MELASNKEFIHQLSAIPDSSFRIQQTHMLYAASGKKLQLQDLSITQEMIDSGIREDNLRAGDIFIQMNPELSQIMPGSELQPEQFLKTIYAEADKNIPAKAMQKLIGPFIPNGWEKGLSVQSANTELNISHGATNEYALNLSQYAASQDGFQNPTLRAAYQRSLYKIMEPIISRESQYDYRVVEDCLASGDTVMGLISMLENLSPGSVKAKKFRLDFAVGTAQGILALQKFAEVNQFQLELNVGYVAFGLSKGEVIPGTEARAHANYITYTDGLRESLGANAVKLAGLDFVVGDMGDAARGLPESYNMGRYPWNQLRDDPWVDQSEAGEWPETFFNSNSKARAIYLANGGFLMRAMHTAALQSYSGSANDMAFFMSAKRMHSDLGYGVIFDKVDIDGLTN